MDISFVIVNRNTRQLLRNCLASIYDTVKELSYEVWVVDNGSSDGSVEMVRQNYPTVRLISNLTNRGFAKANNQALRQIQSRYALLLNSDTVLKKDAIGMLFHFMEEHAEVGLCCGQLLNEDGSKQNSVANFPTITTLLVNETILHLLFPKKYPSKLQEYDQPIAVDSCIGACLMVRKAAMDAVGLLDERYFFFMEETDWALSMQRAGWKSFLVPNARIYHLQGQSAGSTVMARIMFYRSRYQYFRKWHNRQFPLFGTAILLRLNVDLLLNLFANLITLGLNRSLRHKLQRYAQLVFWHLRGCP